MTGKMTLADLLDPGRCAGLLTAGGMREHVAAGKAKLFAKCASAVRDARRARGLGGIVEARAIFVPGRIEVLGKHTDYVGGRSLVAAVERGLCAVAVAEDEPVWRVIAPDVQGACELPISPDAEPPAQHWANYPFTVIRRAAKNFPQARRGATIAYAGDVPRDSGMSSSSVVVTANLLAFAAVNELPACPAWRREIHTPEDLAAYLGTIENGQSFGSLAGDRGVGTFGGSEDHVAMLCSGAGSLAQYAYCPVRLERRIDMPAGLVFVIAFSGVAAAKTGGAREAFNRASRLARVAVEAWNDATGRSDPTLAAALEKRGQEPFPPLRESSRASAGRAKKVPDPFSGVEEIRAALVAAGDRDGFASGELLERFEHFLAESEEIVPAAGDALAAGDLREFGRQVHLSQQCVEKMLRNQTPETAGLVELACQAGAIAASAFGAGFGGSVWALVNADTAGEFVRQWRTRYAERFAAVADRAVFFETATGPAAFELTL